MVRRSLKWGRRPPITFGMASRMYLVKARRALALTLDQRPRVLCSSGVLMTGRVV